MYISECTILTFYLLGENECLRLYIGWQLKECYFYDLYLNSVSLVLKAFGDYVMLVYVGVYVHVCDGILYTFKIKEHV